MPDSDTTTLEPPGLTTGAASFVAEAAGRGDLFIQQPHELYSQQNHDTWRRLLRRIQPRWREFAHPKFLEGVESLALPAERVPRLEDINRFLEPLSGFVARPVIATKKCLFARILCCNTFFDAHVLRIHSVLASCVALPIASMQSSAS